MQIDYSHYAALMADITINYFAPPASWEGLFVVCASIFAGAFPVDSRRGRSGHMLAQSTVKEVPR